MATDVIQGTLDLILLRVLENEPLHGWAIAQRVHDVSDQILRLNQGSLYPALHRLEGRGLITASMGTADNGRRVRVYGLTAAGRKQLARETAGWLEYTRAIQLILRGA